MRKIIMKPRSLGATTYFTRRLDFDSTTGIINMANKQHMANIRMWYQYMFHSLWMTEWHNRRLLEVKGF
jgi:hypothetical protein